ncbi:aminotransferase class V-fold PLP-dependent enzyme [Robiginitalea sediminis]|uniref:aminotransferase class V-fold PLP-dependent enzyme n=1 Tax=Robiginitalea sediminis TaxID=1982593 RepID=UPI000B4BBF61|nr:aminotransferase class V-fold PLP-dependent enzyme [Robiginitalea sediminis]
MTLDLTFTRSQFPAFSQPDLQGWAFFENAGGSYPCKQVVQRLTDFYTQNKVQPYYPYPASERAGDLMDSAYARMATYLNAEPEEVHFGPSTTQNVYVLAHALRPMWQEGDRIIVSCQDHEANAGAWRRLAKRGIEVVEWHVDPQTGVLDPAALEGLFNDRTRLLAFPHCSNIIGHVNPVAELTRMAHAHGALSVVDGVGWAPHEIPDMKALGVDIYMFSSYKTYGPHLGVMYVTKDLMGRVENQAHFFKEGVARSMLTPAGPDHAQVAAVNGILDYFDAQYAHHVGGDAPAPERARALNGLFRAQEQGLLEPLMGFLEAREDVQLVGPGMGAQRAPIVAILPKNKPLEEVYAALTAHKLMLGFGDFYAVRPLMDMGIPTKPGVIRMSFVHYTSPEEIGQLIRGLEAAL